MRLGYLIRYKKPRQKGLLFYIVCGHKVICKWYCNHHCEWQYYLPEVSKGQVMTKSNKAVLLPLYWWFYVIPQIDITFLITGTAFIYIHFDVHTYYNCILWLERRWVTCIASKVMVCWYKSSMKKSVYFTKIFKMCCTGFLEILSF